MFNGPELGSVTDDNSKGTSSVVSLPPEVYMRLDFIKKVYAILTCQLIVTAAISSAISTSDPEWIEHNFGLFWLAFIGSLVTLCTLFVFKNSSPLNLVILGIFTVFESVLIGFIISMYEQSVVNQAVLATAVLFIGLTVYAFTTKKDYSMSRGMMWAACLGLISMMLMNIIFRSSALDLLIGYVGVIVFSFFIIVDTQFIMKRCDLDDYVIGAIELYLDIINLFLYLLKMIFNR
ncbi:hypothetical protein GEMRC1_012365 [Eukaryota sp. GEM-RC1]